MTSEDADNSTPAVERVARRSYSKLLAYLARRCGDIALAEDALSSAFLAALTAWPRDGVPRNPDAWLMTVAKRQLIDAGRAQAAERRTLDSMRLAFTEALTMRDDQGIPDERLRLFFVCAHPSIDASMHTPLMLQLVLGLDAASIARVYVVAPAAMEQRLTRVKRKIRDAAIPLEVPGPDERAARSGAVLDAVYAAYGLAWDAESGERERRDETDQDNAESRSVDLAETLVELLPDDPEARGLAALVLFCESRRAARVQNIEEFVPLDSQDPTRWDRKMMSRAEQHLRTASRARMLGRYQIEAAIQSAHCERTRGGETPWEAVVALYDALLVLSPSIGARVARAGALLQAGRVEAALRGLDEIGPDDAAVYQPYWAVRGHVERAIGRKAEATASFGRALALTVSPAIRSYLSGLAGG